MQNFFSRATGAALLLLCVPVALTVSAPLRTAESAETDLSAPLVAAGAYLKAVHAQDFEAAYGYISLADRRVRDKKTYLRGNPPRSGFALELARWFAGEMKFSRIETHSVDGNRIRLEISYRLPTGDEVAAQLLDWKPDKLNALTRGQQSAIVSALEEVKSTGKMTMIEGREMVVLVQENQGWKIFEDWRSRQRVLFQASRPASGNLAIEFLRNDILVKHEEPFQVDFKVSNPTRREMRLHVKHAFTPAAIDKNIDMIACGSLVPFRLGPGEVREISSVYLFRPGIAARHPVTITYEFATPPSTTAKRTVASAQ